MKSRVAVLLVVVAGVALAGWHYRARLQALVAPPPSAAHPASTPDVLYTWVDSEGVTHYEQESGKGIRVQYDGSRITPVAPVAPELLADTKAVIEDKKAEGSQTLRELRQDLQEGARHMQEAKAAANDL